jgi:hypothetical protein
MRYLVMRGLFAVVAVFHTPHYANGGADISNRAWQVWKATVVAIAVGQVQESVSPYVSRSTMAKSAAQAGGGFFWRQRRRQEWNQAKSTH